MPQAQTQSDPWVEAAKNFKGAPQGDAASAATGGGEDWKVWQRGDDSAPQPNALQRVFDESTAPSSAEDRKGVPNWLNEAGDVPTGFINGLGSLVAHPVKSAEAIGHAFAHPMDTAKQAGEAFDAHPGYTIGQTIGGGVAGAGLVGAATALPKIRLGGYKSPIVPAAESASENLAKAILPPEGVTPNLVKAIQLEAPAVREYAGRTSNPLKTVPEGMKAAEGVAQEGLQHYRTNFLEPNAHNQVILGGDSPTLGHVSTLGEVEKRISDINDLTRGAATRAKSAGAEMTAQERLGLENEGKALRQKLYSALSEKTGVPPEDIQGMREGYGGQFALKNALEGGHMQRLTRVGLESQGAGTGIYPSKAGIIDKAMTALRGGPERIANRQFAKRINAFEPEVVTRPMPARLPQAPFEPSTPISESMARQVNAVEPAGATGVQPQPVAAPRTNGPIAKAPTILENEKASQDFQDQQNAAARMKKEANRASAGKRLQGGQ